MNVVRIVQNDTGRVQRVEVNGVRLPIEVIAIDITRDFACTLDFAGARRPWEVRLTMFPDDVEMVTETTVVDADPSPVALIEAPK